MTEAEILQELQDALEKRPAGDEGLTVDEMSSVTGHSATWVRKAIRSLMADGRIVVGQRPGFRIDGRRCTHPVYRVKA